MPTAAAELRDADLAAVTAGKELRAEASEALRDISRASRTLESKTLKVADSLGIK